MRNFSMSVVMRERDRPQKMWQPWYMDEAEGGGKELPSRTQREQRARERVTINRHPSLLLPGPHPPHHHHHHHHHLHPPHSPACSSDEDEINVVDLTPPGNSAPHAYTHGAHAFPMEEEACEGPLDMSTKRRSPTHSTRPQNHAQNSPSPPPYHPRPYYLPRPSVITCVAPKYPHAPAPAHVHREPPPYSVATALLTQQRTHSHAMESRQVMQAGSVDPEIDEHFRRSLGQDYHHLFAAPSPPTDPSTDSVDDHFAKALGETWTKLQAERKDTSSSSSSSSSSTSSSSTSSTSSTLTEGGGGGGGGEGEEGGNGRRGHGLISSSSSSTSSSSTSSTSSTLTEGGGGGGGGEGEEGGNGRRGHGLISSSSSSSSTSATSSSSVTSPARLIST